MWVNFQTEEKKSSAEDNFTGKVVEIHSGDSLTVERESDLERVRLFLACIKAPKEAKPFGEKGQQ
jgi:endonuclease YncB( thermonuclease family)